jgi:hypothetical protein
MDFVEDSVRRVEDGGNLIQGPRLTPQEIDNCVSLLIMTSPLLLDARCLTPDLVVHKAEIQFEKRYRRSSRMAIAGL